MGRVFLCASSSFFNAVYVGTEVEDDEVFEEKLAERPRRAAGADGKARDLEAGVDEVFGKLLSG